jgi:hypothetical protein
MKRLIKTILKILIFFVLALFVYLFVGNPRPAEKVEWGLTFSKRPIVDFEMDWKEVLLAILDELKVKKIRLVVYWNEIEKEDGKYDFSELDWQINEVSKRGGEIVLAVGRRVPRWPECFEPEWIKSFPEGKKQEKVLALISETINRYKDNKNIGIWQIENEPFLRTFGECPKLDKGFFDKEIALAKSIDSSRPIMITESGEFSTWIGGAKRADIVGTSLYRKIYGKLGYVKYPIPPVFYQRKTILIKTLFDIKDIIAVEVQAEPWGNKPNQTMTTEEQDMSMSFEAFNDVLEYTRRAGFNKAYLWGAEWWYWRKIKFNDSKFWDRAKELF